MGDDLNPKTSIINIFSPEFAAHQHSVYRRMHEQCWHRRIPNYEIKPGESPRYSPGIREVRYLPLVWENS